MVIEKLVQRLIEKIPTEYSDLEKARYVYISLAKIFTFDENYYIGNSKMHKKLILTAKHEPIKDKEVDLSKKNKAICISIAKTYNYVLNKIGINANLYNPNQEDPHVCSRIEIGDKSYLADLQLDLLFIQMNRPTRFFGRGFSNESLTDEELSQIDDKIGYDYNGENEVSKIIKNLIKKCNEINCFPKEVEYIIQELGKIDCLKDMELVEIDTFYSWILKRMFKLSDYTNIRKNFLYSLDENRNRSEYDYYLSVLNSGKSRERSYDRYEFDRAKKKFRKIDEIDFRSKIKGKISAKGIKILGIKEKDKNREE